ncbi:MAG TPA: MqnA/MqnD/SBP family protein, partial [Edaphobacter sp.]
MALITSHPVRVAAINFLNPAPLMWDFEHPPRAAALADHYQLHYTLPSLCADELLSARADLGLIPIASLSPDLAIVPNCVIASLDHVRSIQLIVKSSASDPTRAFQSVRTVAADTASRSSLVYAEILFRKFLSTHPAFIPTAADAIAMLGQADAAILIGDPAFLALESRAQIEQAVGPCHWFDLAHEWRTHTGL